MYTINITIFAIVTIARLTANSVCDLVKSLGVSGVRYVATLVCSVNGAAESLIKELQTRYGIKNGDYAWDAPERDDAIVTHGTLILMDRLGDNPSLDDVVYAVYDMFANKEFAEALVDSKEYTDCLDAAALIDEEVEKTKFYSSVHAGYRETLMGLYLKGNEAIAPEILEMFEYCAEGATSVMFTEMLSLVYALVHIGIEDKTILAALEVLGYEGGEELISIIKA